MNNYDGSDATSALRPYKATTTTYHTARAGGLDLFYREAGPRDAPTILLLHGFPSSSRMWRDLLPLLADDHHLVAPDYPGSGQSGMPPDDARGFGFDGIAAVMGALLEHLGVGRCTLFMQDYGGPVGFRMALAAPEKVQAMIIQNANAYVEGLGPKWDGIARFWSDPSSHPDQVDAFLSLEGARRRHLGETPHPERYDPESWMDEHADLCRPGQREFQASLLLDYRSNVEAYATWQAWLRRYRPPLLVLWGRYDTSFLVPGAEGYARDVPGAEVHVLEAGHFALDERVEEVADLTRDFIGRRVRSSPAT